MPASEAAWAGAVNDEITIYSRPNISRPVRVLSLSHVSSSLAGEPCSRSNSQSTPNHLRLPFLDSGHRLSGRSRSEATHAAKQSPWIDSSGC